MNNILLGSIAGATIVTAGAIGTYIYLQRRKKNNFVTEQIETELQFEDVMSYLKTLNLDKEKHVPFIANCNNKEMMSNLKAFIPAHKEGYNLLIVGAYDNNNNIVNGKFIYSLGLSEELTKILGNEPIVVLS